MCFAPEPSFGFIVGFRLAFLLGKCNILVVQAALLFRVLPHLFTVCHFFTPLYEKDFIINHLILKSGGSI